MAPPAPYRRSRKIPAGATIGLTLTLLLTCPAAAQNTKENADFKLAINLYNDGLFDLAAEQLKQFVNAYPGTDQGIEARFYLGLTQFRLKQYDVARIAFQTFALTYQTHPKAPDAWWQVGESFAAVKSYREAALAFERVKVFHPKSKRAPDALVEAGKNFALAGEPDNARRVLRIVLQEYPSSAAVLSARTQLGQIYFAEGNFEQAQNELRRVVDGDPSADAKAQALLILGNINQSIGRMDRARSEYQEIIAKYKGSSAVQGAYVNLARLQREAGEHTSAIENFKKALAEKGTLDSTLIREAMIGIGDAQSALKEHANAVGQYERFLTSFPNDPMVSEVTWKLARESARAKSYKKSNDICTRLIRSGAPEALKRRAQLQLALNAQEQRNPTLAVQLYASFIEQYGDDPAAPEVLFRAATIQERDVRDVRKASVVFELLFSRHPTSALADDALAGAARCEEQLREYIRAAQLWRDLLQRYPASEFRRTAEERIRMIDVFEAKDKDAGLEKLALLVGDVVGEKDKAGLAFRLGEIYFTDLKNYGAAATQFTTAYTAGLAGSSTAEALYRRAKSYEYLSWKEEKYRTQAIESYQTFLQTTAQEQSQEVASWREDAAVSLFTLNATTLGQAQSAYQATLVLAPSTDRRSEMLLRLGTLQADAESTASALQTFTEIASLSPPPPAREEALYRRFDLLVKAVSADSAFPEGLAFLEDYPSGPYSARILATVASIAIQHGEYARAAELFQKLSTGFPYTQEGSSARRSLADATLLAGRHREAIDLYTELLQQQSDDILTDGVPDQAVLLGLGKSHFLAGNNAEAKQFLFRTIALGRSGPAAAEAYTALGMIYKAEGSMEIATSYFRLAGAVSPAAVSKEVADLLFESEQYVDALAQYQKLLASAESDAEKRFINARILVAKLRSDDVSGVDKGIEAFAGTYPDAEPDLASFELEKGNYHFRQKKYPAALKSFQTVASKYDNTPSAPAARYWIGRTYEASGKPKEAAEQLTGLLNDSPDDPIAPRAHLALGNIFYGMEQWDEAIRHYRKVVEDPGPDSTLLPYALSNLIETYEITNINDAALSLTRRYLELYPNNEDSFDKRIKIGILYNRLGYYDQSVMHLQGLLDQAGSDLEGEIRYYIAEANFAKGDYQQAILDFLKVPYLVTKKGKIDWTANSLYMSGQSYEKMGRHEQALAMYQQIIDRPGIDETYRAAAKKEIERVKLVLPKKAR